MFCHTCGADAGRSAFCPRCGTRLLAESGQPPQPQPGPPVPVAPRPPSGRSTALVALGGVAVGVVIVLLVTIVFLLRDDGGSSGPEEGSLVARPSSSASESPTATPSESPTDRADKPDREQVEGAQAAGGASGPQAQGGGSGGSGTGPGDVRTLPAGLFCRDLHAQGYSYSAAVDYWRMHGQPNQMDADRDGIPCETVYSSGDVEAYWGTYDVPSGSYPSGLYCRDLYARGASYSDAVAYWYAEGTPDRMDADLNGIPCETVYSWSDVAAYWGSYEVPGTYYEPGLYCRDLYSRGASYAEAVAYWFSEGAPDRMDADRNGIPCETVYPYEVIYDYWY